MRRAANNRGEQQGPPKSSPPTRAEPTCNFQPASAYVVGMRKTSRIVPITPDQYRLIASDEKSHRVIFAIGKRRIALDFFTRITDLPPATGDYPAQILPMKKKLKLRST